MPNRKPKTKKTRKKQPSLDRRLFNESLKILALYRVFLETALILLVGTLDGLSRAPHSRCLFCLEPEGSHTAVCPIHGLRESVKILKQINTR